MKKILISMLSILILIGLTACNSRKENMQPTQNWSDNLERAVQTYNQCPEGWESNVVPRPYLPAKMYCNRPRLPDNFGDVQLLYETGKIIELDKIGSDYYDQPEFFPNFKAQTVRVLNDFNPNRFGVTIPETFPSAKVFEQVKPGSDLEADFLVRSGPLGEKYIWVDTYLTYPQTFQWARNLNKPMETNPKDVEKMFVVTLSEHTILLEPSFPVWPKNWTKKIDMTVHVKENTPSGRYAIGVSFDHTTNATLVEDAWFKYGTYYSDTLLVKPSTPWYILYIEVIE